MDKGLSAILLFLIFSGLNFTTASNSHAADASKGKVIYNNICASCHGMGGKGDGVAAAALNPKPRDLSSADYVSGLSDEHLIKVISKGGPSVGKSFLMPPWEGTLTSEDITNVVEYIRVDICKCRPK